MIPKHHFLVIFFVVAVVSFLAGVGFAHSGSIAKAAQDCRWHSMFEYNGVDYACTQLSTKRYD